MRKDDKRILLFSTFNYCQRYTSAKTTVFTLILAVLLSLFFQVVVKFDWHHSIAGLTPKTPC